MWTSSICLLRVSAELVKPRKISITTVCVPADILTGHFRSTSENVAWANMGQHPQERGDKTGCCLSNLRTDPRCSSCAFLVTRVLRTIQHVYKSTRLSPPPKMALTFAPHLTIGSDDKNGEIQFHG
jgi:hypothetical protein